ncbi:MAG: PEP/pyruvate-binding domain-containing protein [Candidatus Uhrbacteria bacterium]
MKNNFLQIDELDNFQKFLGPKTLNLKKCLDWGFTVPKFVAIPADACSELFCDLNLRKQVVEEISIVLKSKSYAVRSSALIEDSEEHSLAGQLLTKTAIKTENLAEAILEVLKQADDYLKGELEKFSIIVQEYIPATISGVTFTRNPNGNREMILEYGLGEGEKIVGGLIKPERREFYWNETTDRREASLPVKPQVIEIFKELETKYSLPQDIEWCLKDEQFYLLQTRPITTISNEQYKQILFLEKTLPTKTKFYLEKTEISEMTPRPTPITFGLLNLLYSENGPIKKVYQKYQVAYQKTDFLKIIGNELYLDKEREIKSLLPTYSYLKNKNFSPRLNGGKNIWLTLKNFWFINKISTKNYQNLFEQLKNKLEQTPSKDPNLKIALANFLEDYELIFEINLMAGLASKKINFLLKNEPVNFPEIINLGQSLIATEKYAIEPPKNLIGNSLEISDKTIFTASKNLQNKTDKKTNQWFNELSEYKKLALKDKVIEAAVLNRFREFGRWLVVKHLNTLRTILLYSSNSELIFFANLDEVLQNKINDEVCLKRKNEYLKYNNFNLPNYLTSSPLVISNKTIGVSSGLAKGILLTVQDLENKKFSNEKIILYTQTLSPDLTKHFHRIAGILSDNGGLLSHLAIMARENNLPVVVNFSLEKSEIKIGDSIEIDGGSGEINSLSEV